jgi:hypothetical protein
MNKKPGLESGTDKHQQNGTKIYCLLRALEGSLLFVTGYFFVLLCLFLESCKMH